jgi:hypothetical protein
MMQGQFLPSMLIFALTYLETFYLDASPSVIGQLSPSRASFDEFGCGE